MEKKITNKTTGKVTKKSVKKPTKPVQKPTKPVKKTAKKAAKKVVKKIIQINRKAINGKVVKCKSEDITIQEPVVKAANESDVLWDKIRNLQIDIFGLPEQYVAQYAVRQLKNIPDVIYLELKSSAVLTALEEVLHRYSVEKDFPGKKIEIERVSRYTTLKLVSKNGI